MTVAAIRFSRHVNGVSKRHGEVSRQIWSPLWPDREAREVPITHVTNGVHVETWMAREIAELLDRHLGGLAGSHDRYVDLGACQRDR
jgi:starch phosphorylase